MKKLLKDQNCRAGSNSSMCKDLSSNHSSAKKKERKKEKKKSKL
jgi:hypothetical protein